MRALLQLRKYLIRYKYHFVAGVAALIVIDLLQLMVPRVLRAAIDGLASGIIGLSGLGRYFFIIAALACGIAVGRFFWRYLIIGSSRRIERALRTDFYEHLLTLDFSYFDNAKTGDLMAHAVNDINAVRMALGFGFIILIDIVIIGVAAIGMMISISPRLTLYALIPFPVIAIVSTRFGWTIHHFFEKVQEAFAVMTERVRENLSGMRVVKVFVQEKGEIEKFDALSNDYVTKNVRLIRIWSLFFPMIMLFAALGEAIVLLFGGRFVIQGIISIGSFVAFMYYLQILVWPMIAIGRAINLFQRGAASQGRLNRIFQQHSRIKSGEQHFETLHHDIQYRDVSFTYLDKNEPALHNVTMTIHAREFVGITGRIASGKTSLVNLLLRLYQPQEGQILIDGTSIQGYSLQSLRGNIAYVPQDTFLFSDTIRANITFGAPDARDGDVERVSRIAHVYEEIMEFPKGFDTRIGERGVTLSGGQKQRIALARALLLDRPILILDDAVSSVDAETELKILDAIEHELTSRTSIVISHRVFVLQGAARIYVFDKGRIVEQGTHDELLHRHGIYHEIHTIQQLEMKIGDI
ncbi:ABC transporter ATP-binding protein [candidate division WOR-3 bacterium]|nr:ABC transporter ATP-binding protein [candidate division WOR-3 bacterium]